tara:strand:+ start:35151 stop:36338 length:1188 start_codon:yes stop_codon:yes gene_type:complete
MFQNLKLFIKYNIPFFFKILKKLSKIIRLFKNIFNLVIIEFLSIFNIQLNIGANPLININQPIVINLSGFDHILSIKFLNYFYSKKNSKIYNLNKYKKNINLLKNNLKLNYSNNNCIIPLSVLESFLYSDSNFITREINLNKIKPNDYLYFDNNSKNVIIIKEKWAFFHFYLQIIPFIIQNNNRKKFNILLRKQNKKFFNRLLKIFFSNIKIKKINLQEFRVLKKFIIINNNFYPNKKHIFLLREFLKVKYKLNYKNSSNELIYIKRSQGSYENYFKRQILNEKKLISILKTKYKFKIVDPLKINNIQQIKLFNKCRGIISIHGANLSNIIVCNKNCKILELNKNFDVKWHYYKIFNDLGYSNNFKIMITKIEREKIKLSFNETFFKLLDNHFKN